MEKSKTLKIVLLLDTQQVIDMVISVATNDFTTLAGNIFDVKMNIDGQTITASR